MKNDELRRKKYGLSQSIAITILLLVIAHPGFSEIVVLNSGKKLVGSIKERTDQVIKLDVNGAPLSVNVADIQMIENHQEIEGLLTRYNTMVNALERAQLDDLTIRCEDFVQAFTEFYKREKEAQSSPTLELFQKIFPLFDYALSMDALSYMNFQHHEEAGALIDLALLLRPNTPIHLFWRGVIAAKKAQQYATWGIGKQAIEKVVVQALEDLKIAKNAFEQEVQNDKSTLNFLSQSCYWLGYLQLKFLGDRAQAEAFFKSAVEADKNNQPAAEELSRLMGALKK